ncbi:LysE family translocator [Dongia rigui]|uniref:LysE family transporter n=1 Tax=Dongia rigui TaxID=940149 RepID=A0ABU5E2N4_9PROT|nr:LysE family transporter [Dongia rigui]MDY0873469.1 LysE family transporter [Dongia rigui]
MELLTWHIPLIVKGIIIGFAVAAPVGPIGMLCIRLTLEKDRAAGFCGGLGAAVADTIFAAVGALALIGAFGLTSGARSIEAYRSWLELGGGLFLVAFGVHLGLKRPVIAASDEEVPQTLLADFLRTTVLTLANPSTILSFIGIFAGASVLSRLNLADVPELILGVFLGSAGWWLTLAVGVGFIRHMISEAVFIWLNRIAGGLLVAFGFVTLIHLAVGYFSGGQ